MLSGPSCVPLPTDQSVCSTAEGDVKTYNVIGVWKKVPQTAVERKSFSNGNFRLLYIVQGGADAVLSGGILEDVEVYYNSSICEKAISNNLETEIKKAGLYFHDDGRMRIRSTIVDIADGQTEPEEKWSDYSFSGNCAETKLFLKSNGVTETYTFFSANPPTDACKFEQANN